MFDWLVETKLNADNNNDVEDMTKIDSLVFEHPWTRADFAATLLNKHTRVFLVRTYKVVGYALAQWPTVTKEDYRLSLSSVPSLAEFEPPLLEAHLMNVAVHPDYHETGIGTTIIQGMLTLLRHEYNGTDLCDVRFVRTEVWERNVRAQMFLRKMGFKALQVMPGFYTEVDDAAYDFGLNVMDPDKPPKPRYYER